MLFKPFWKDITIRTMVSELVDQISDFKTIRMFQTVDGMPEADALDAELEV